MYKLTLNDYLVTKEGVIINKTNNRVLRPGVNSKGYLRVSIGGVRMFVHRLVAEQYVPNPENKPQVNHKDGNKLNNHYTNLEWVTNQENRDHTVRSNLQISGSKCPWAKLTEDDVLFIRKSSLSNTQLAKMFNVQRGTIQNIKQYKRWKQLKSYAELS